MPNHSRLNLFDLLRFLAAIFVIYSHSFPLLNLGNNHGTDLAHQIWPFTDAGAIGVYIFFTISGFLNAKSVAKNPPSVFYINRCLRIFPGLLVALLFTVFIIGPLCTTVPLGTYFTSMQTWLYLSYTELLLPGHSTLPGVFDNNLYKNAVNGSLWTLRIEFILYLLLPLVINISPKKSISALLPTIFFLILYFASAHSGLIVINNNMLNMLNAVSANAFFFFAGAAIARLNLGNASMRQIIILFLLILVTARFSFAPLVFFILLPLLIIKTGSIETRTLILKNDISYGLYIYAFPIQQTTYHFLSTSLSPAILALLACIATTIPAILSWFFIEKPILTNRNLITAKIHGLKWVSIR